MAQAVRIVFSTDHSRKKTRSVDIPFGLYLDFVTSAQFETILPKTLKPSFAKAKAAFKKDNPFLNWSEADQYAQSPYVRMVTSEAVHKFLAKVLSLHYQSQKHLLDQEVGSLSEFLNEEPTFWNETYLKRTRLDDLGALQGSIFCWGCLKAQYDSLREKEILKSRLPDFAKAEIKAKDEEIKKLQSRLKSMEQELESREGEIAALQADLDQANQQNIVIVPGDPYHMLGLPEGVRGQVGERSKSLMKALHPDKTGTNETAYLFDMVKKARDMIVKG